MRRFPRYTAMAWKSLLILPIFTVAVLTVVAGPSQNTAQIMDATGPLTVLGYVYDLGGQPLEGANVVVTILRTGATASGVTGTGGSYQALPDIPYTGYDLDDTIQVVATYNSHQQTATAKVTQQMMDDGIAQVDVHYTYEIPEFGSGLGFALVLVIVCAVAVVILGRRTVV